MFLRNQAAKRCFRQVCHVIPYLNRLITIAFGPIGMTLDGRLLVPINAFVFMKSDFASLGVLAQKARVLECLDVR